jgi:hypothetical protein
LTKQTVVAAPAACVLYLLLSDRRGALRFLIALAVIAAIPFGALLAATRGQAWLHLVTYNRNAMHWNELAGWARMVWGLSEPLALATALLAARYLFQFRISQFRIADCGLRISDCGLQNSECNQLSLKLKKKYNSETKKSEIHNPKSEILLYLS